MKAKLSLLVVALVAMAVVTSVIAVAQSITTNGTGGGVWSSTATWAGGVVPTGADTIKIASTDSVIFDVPVTITGTLVKLSAKRDSIGASGSLTFASGGTYQHAVNGGSVPVATWSTGSTCLLTGLSGSMPSNMAQNFYNLTVNCPNYSGNLNVGWQKSSVTIGGTLSITNTGYNHSSITTPNAQFRLFGGNGNCTIDNIVINGYGGLMTPMGSNYTDTITVLGNITISSGGALSLANNSSASGIFLLKGNLAIVDSGFVTKSSSANLSKIVFCGIGTQTLTRPANTWSTDAFLSGVNFEVAGGATLSFPAPKDTLSGSGSFKVDSLATLVCNHPLGVNGIVRNSGSNGGGNLMSTSASFVFSGTSAQVTGTKMPASVKTVVIDNPAGVTSSQSLTITDTLFLLSGTLSGPYTANVTVTNIPPAAPVNLVVFDTSSTKIGIKWRQNTERDFLRYRIYRSTSPAPTTQVDSTTGGIADTSKVFTGLTNGTTYYLRVTAVDSAGLESRYSNEVRGTPTAGNVAPAAPVNLVVFDTTSTKIGIKWRKNTESDFLRYRIYRGVSPAPTTTVDSTTGGIADTSKVFTGLTNGTKYYLRVTAVDSAGLESPYSNEVSGTPGTAVAVEQALGKTPTEYSLSQNYPNPFNPSTVIGYDLPKSSTVKITVYDILGNEVEQLANGVQSVGYHSVTFNAQNLASGMYFYKIQAGNFTQTKKMILLK